MDLLKRKLNRIPAFDYNQQGAYFVTLCTQNRQKILSRVAVGAGLPACPPEPQAVLLPGGIIVDRYIRQLDQFYRHISVEKYIIMPDHVHLLLVIHGQARRPAPTKENDRNTEVSKFVGTLKRFSNKEYGKNIWQRSYYDHVIRNQHDFDEIWEYIDNNPRKWAMHNGESEISP